MKVYYIFDSYCGWCYGFETILKPFIEAHPELEVTALSGGLFMDGHPLSAFPYMSDTNKRIADMFGVEFGKPYLNLLETGSIDEAVELFRKEGLPIDSEPADLLLDTEPKMNIRVAFVRGKAGESIEIFQER